MGPTAVGFDVTVNVQLAPAPNEAGQLFVCVNAPLTEIVPSVTAAPDSFVSVAVCAALLVPVVTAANVRDPGVNNRDPWVPVPVSVAVCGLLAPLSANEIDSFFAPVDVGRNSTETVHEAPPANGVSGAGQVFAVITKSLPIVIESRITLEVKLFVSVSVFAPELEPTWILPQLSDVGDSVTGAANPVPLNFALCGSFVASSVTVSVALCAPAACGVKLTEIVQLEFPASELPHVFVCVKFASEIATPRI